MMTLWIMGYFLAACALIAMLLWPTLRISVAQRIRAIRQRQAAGTGQDKLGAQRSIHGSWRGRMILLALALVMVSAPVIVAWYGGQARPPGFDLPARSESEVVAALLRGEQLVPPPPLPPDLFMTPEVQTESPQLARADRRWDLLDLDFRQRLLWVYKVMKEQHGYDMVLVEGYRSPERQDLLSQQGPHVTLARAWQSYHQYGLAADSVFLRDGKLVISERDPWARRGYELYGQVAIDAGLVWGGRWQNADLTHVELRTSPRSKKP